MTAYFGMRECGPLMPRDSVAVAGATGSVGSIAAQLGGLPVVTWSGLAAAPIDANGRWIPSESTSASIIEPKILRSGSRLHSQAASTFTPMESAALLRRPSQE